MWGNPTFFHQEKLKKNIDEKINIYTINWEKLLIDPQTTNCAIYPDSVFSKKMC